MEALDMKSLKGEICNKALMHIMRCEDCFSTIQQYIISISAANAGSTTSAAKAEAARANGKKGGRPKKL